MPTKAAIEVRASAPLVPGVGLHRRALGLGADLAHPPRKDHLRHDHQHEHEQGRPMRQMMGREDLPHALHGDHPGRRHQGERGDDPGEGLGLAVAVRPRPT